MRTTLALLLGLALAAGAAYGEEKKAKPAAKKSQKNIAQKAEADLLDAADKYNIWKRRQKKD